VSLQPPPGKQLAVCVTVDFDAHSVWMGAFGRTTPGYLSRGEFGATDGARRLLALFAALGIRTTWFIPGHTLETFPGPVAAVVEAGHEIGAHGCYHETLAELPPGREEALLQRQLEQHVAVVGRRPRGYRSPAWDFTEETLGLLERYGFEWDSSLMGREFAPYHPRPVTVGWESGSTFGDASPVLEIPVSWYTVDWESFEFVPGVSAGLAPTDAVERRWLDIFDFARTEEPGGVLVLTVHPQTSGRSHLLVMLRRVLSAIAEHEEVWFATLSEVSDRCPPAVAI
jgi:peptidoglycan/xylan/chitin deacetylase (PgdA/CDA1 family)